MTDDLQQAIRDDLAFMRALAQEGRRTPLLGGGVFVAAGGIFGLASLAHWAVASGVVAASGLALMLIWTAAAVVYLTVLTVLLRGRMRRPGALSPGNRATGAAWSALGMTIFAFAVILALAAWRLQQPQILDVFAPLILGLYGAGWLIASAMSERGWLKLTALGTYFAALAAAWLVGRPEQYLVFAAALVLFMAVPGVAILRQEPAEVV